MDLRSILVKYNKEFEKLNFSLDDWLLDLKNYVEQKLIQRNDKFEIYQAINKDTKEKFMIKTINDTFDHFFQIETSDFFRDFYFMTKLNHLSILKLVGFCPINFEGDQKPVFVTEFYKETLYDLLQDKKVSKTEWNPTKKLINIYGIASSMYYIHKKNIIYRNLTSKNILLDDLFYPKLFNFSQCKEIDKQQSKDKMNDVYDFSKIVFEIMTNREFTKELFLQLKDEIPKSYYSLIEECCSEKKSKRPSFKNIVKKLKKDSGFIVDGVDYNLFKEYVKMIKETTFQNDVNRLNQLVITKLKKLASKTYLNLEQYEIVEEIGNGAFAKIFQIQEKETGKIFAAKVYNENSIDNPEKLEPQFKEIKILTKLNHPSIMKYIGYSPTDLKFNLGLTIVIETGEMLENIISLDQDEQIKSGWNQTKKLINIYGIASGMKYLHSMGVIHRNLRCGNIIEDENFYPKICSFSLFKYLYELDNQVQDQYFFNPYGSPPEVLSDQKYSKSSDVYSFAIIVYEIMTNDDPYPDIKNVYQLVGHVSMKNLRPKFNKPIPKCYQDLIESCWSTEPEKRPSFESIIDKLKTDESFITDDVDRDEYKKYIEYIDQVTDSLDYLDINDFEKIEKIGQGNFSTIFKTREKSTNKYYAAKVLKKEIDDLTEEENNLLSRELKIMKKINHSSIIKIKGFSPFTFNYNAHPTIIIELGNCTLQSILDLEKNCLSPSKWDFTKKLINIYGIAHGMKYLHSLNIIHRDLKPLNILEDDFLFPKISDFGLSKEIHKNIQSISFQSDLNQKGTPFYIAPEIWKECNYTKVGDVYSFSMIVYEIISVEKPFNDFGADFVTKIINGERPKFNDIIPECYQKLIEKCWSQDLNNRPTFSEIVELLKTNDFMNDLINIDEYLKYIDYVEKFNDINAKNFEFDKIDKIDLIQQQNNDLITFSQDVPKYDLKNLIRKEKLGSGNFSKVYKVANYTTGEIYAAKVLKNELILCPKNEQINFCREVNILSKLNHKSIIKFYGYSLVNFKQEDRPVLITEILTKGTLEDVLKMESIGYPLLDWNETKKFINIYGIASAMKYLHSKSYIHRDLKPQNILMDNNLYPKLSDFGLSKSYPLENTKVALGTPIYMAPEIWFSYEYTKAVDVYAYSLIVYEIITNKKPFNEMNIFMLCIKITEQYRPELIEEIPSCYKELITRCWNQDPSQRPTFDEIVDILKNKPEFKNEKVDLNEFNKYVEFIENEFTNNDQSKQNENASLTDKKDEFVISLFYKVIEADLSNEFVIDLNNNYEQKEIIRKDNFQKIFKIVQKDSNKVYTARSIDIDLSQFKKDEIFKIIKELDQLYHLNHQSIIKFIGFSPCNFKKESKPIFINELSPKLTLSDIIKNEKKKLIISGWNSTKKLIIIYGIASAMKYLHSKNIIHQNLKPENIYIDEYFHPKISEFGSFNHKLLDHSMALQSASKVKALIYSAPEVLENGICTKESDVYSFCLIIYELITNENLNNSLLTKRKKFDSKTLVPSCYVKFIEKGLSTNPSDRPTFAQIVDFLENDASFITPDVSKIEYTHFIKKVSCC